METARRQIPELLSSSPNRFQSKDTPLHVFTSRLPLHSPPRTGQLHPLGNRKRKKEKRKRIALPRPASLSPVLPLDPHAGAAATRPAPPPPPDPHRPPPDLSVLRRIPLFSAPSRLTSGSNRLWPSSSAATGSGPRPHPPHAATRRAHRPQQQPAPALVLARDTPPHGELVIISSHRLDPRPRPPHAATRRAHRPQQQQIGRAHV